jgi:hypothetical protein
MPITYVGAGAGAERLITGTGTVSKTGCKAGNIIFFHGFMGADSGQDGFTNFVNAQGLNGTPGAMDVISNAVNRQVFIGRVTADGTVSADMSVGAAGDDFAARIYEFTGVSTGASIGTVAENVNSELGFAIGTTVTAPDVTTLGANRLALNFVNLRTAQTLGDFTGESGGDWTEVAEYVATTMTLQLQTAVLTSPGTITGGTQTVSSTYWITCAAAIIASPFTGLLDYTNFPKPKLARAL